MKRRKSRTAVLERDLAEIGSKAGETVSELAEHAVAVAREVGHAATPALQHSAVGLSRALERAGESLAEAGERLAKNGEHQAAEAAHSARLRLADASERLAEAVRPKKKHHRVRNAAIALVVVGGVVALVQSPLRAKLTERLFGPPPADEEPEAITLPDTGAPQSTESQPSEAAEQQFQGSAPEQGNGLPTTPAGAVDTAQA